VVWQVWKYQHTTSVADKAIEQLNAMVQTPQGLKEFRVLVTGSMNGSIR
jgi:WD repeat-containing protein 21A